MGVDPILNTIDLHREKSPSVHVTNLDKRFEKKSLQGILFLDESKKVTMMW